MKKYTYLFAAAMTFFAATNLSASVLFDTGVGSSFTPRTSDGPGQGVSVGVNTTLTQIGFYMDAPTADNVKFLIFDGTNSTLLFSETQPLAASNNISLVLSNPFSFDLLAGNTYYFGVISDNAENVSYIFPPTSSTQNNLSLVNPNSNYGNFASPTFDGLAGATIALELVGTQGTSATPEPGTLVSISGAGLLALAAAYRKRRV